MALDTALAVGSIAFHGTSYPIYGTYARAIEYLTVHADAANFMDAVTDTKIKALVTARRWLDRQTWTGAKAVTSQVTAFPRDSDSTVPLDIEFAQYELALVLVGDAAQYATGNTGSNQRRLRAGSVEIEFFHATDGSGSYLTGAGSFPPQALDLVRGYLAAPSSVLVPYVGGTATDSRVIGYTEYDLSEPY